MWKRSAHLTRGIELLITLPETAERAQHELTLQIALGTSLRRTKGWAAPEVEHAYTRARELCQQVGDTPQLFPVLWGLAGVYVVRAENQAAQEMGEQLLSLAQRAARPNAPHGGPVAWRRRLVLTWRVCHCPRAPGAGLCPLRSAAAPPPYCLFRQWTWGCFSSPVLHHALWHLGYPDQALPESDEALTLAQELAHPYSLALALDYTAMLHQFRHEAHAARERAEAAMALCTEHGFAYYLAWATIIRGWALTAQGQREEGLAQMRQGLADLRATGAEDDCRIIWPCWPRPMGKPDRPQQG